MQTDWPKFPGANTGKLQLDAKDTKLLRDGARKKMSSGVYKTHQRCNDVLSRMARALRTLSKAHSGISRYKLANQQAANDALSKLHGLARA